MAVSKLKQQDVLDVCVDAGELKAPAGGRVLRKASVVWRLSVLVLVAACGIYMCLIGVDQKVTYGKLSLDPIQQAWTRELLCPRLSRLPAAAFPQHYPQPRGYSRAECSCTPVHYFVLLSMQRSGSGWLETLLNSHPNVSSHGEIFSVKERRTNFTTIKQTLDAVYNLDWVSSAAKNECTAAVGFKWMLNQGALEYGLEVAEYLKRRGVSVILLLRRNSLKRLISILGNAYDRAKPLNNATHVAHVHTKEEADLLASYKPTIDVRSLASNLRRVQEISSDALRLFNVTRVALLTVADALQPFLGVPWRRLESRHVKIHTRPMSASITNWDEVYRSLNGTEFARFLHDRDYL